jgi:hypothetical protein
MINASKLMSREELGDLFIKLSGKDIELSFIGNVFYESICSFQENQKKRYMRQQAGNIKRHEEAEQRKKNSTEKIILEGYKGVTYD